MSRENVAYICDRCGARSSPVKWKPDDWEGVAIPGEQRPSGVRFSTSLDLCPKCIELLRAWATDPTFGRNAVLISQPPSAAPPQRSRLPTILQTALVMLAIQVFSNLAIIWVMSR